MAVYLGSTRVALKGGTFNTDGTTINNQNKTVTPTTSQQIITADSGYTGLGTVTVNRIPTNYIVPSGNKEITANGTGIDVSAYSTVSVAVPASGGGTTINNQDKTVTPSTSKQTVTADSGYTGLGTVTVNAIPSSYVQPSATKGAATITPGTSNQTIAAGTYLTGAQTIAGDADLKGSNILSGVSIFGVAGTVDLTTVYVSTSAPSSSTGSNGDIYIQK